jgi:hypothetical protein
MNSTTNIDTATAISAATCFPFASDGIAVGNAVIVGHGPCLGVTAATGTYLGHTLDGLAVVRIDGQTEDLGAGPGVEEWPFRFVASLAVTA